MPLLRTAYDLGEEVVDARIYADTDGAVKEFPNRAGRVTCIEISDKGIFYAVNFGSHTSKCSEASLSPPHKTTTRNITSRNG